MQKDDGKKELEKLKQLSFKQKLEYIWDYYKPLLAGIAGVVILLFVVIQIILNSQITTELTVGLFNSNGSGKDIDILSADFASASGLDGKKQELVFDSSYYIDPDANDSMTLATQSKLVAVLSAGNMDVMLVTEDLYKYYLDAGMFADLKQVLAPEEYSGCRELFMMDKSGDDPEVKAYGLSLVRNEKLTNIFPEDQVILCVAVNAGKTENIRKFVQYILS